MSAAVGHRARAVIAALTDTVFDLFGDLPKGGNSTDKEGVPELGGRFYNSTGGSLTKGTPVYVTGKSSTIGGAPVTVAKAQAGAVGKRAQFVVLETTADAAFGVMVPCATLLTTLDTSAATIGDKVYLSTTAGGLTLTGGSGDQVVGYVKTVATAGVVSFMIPYAPSAAGANYALQGVLSAAGTSVTNSTTETASATVTIPANSIRIGTVIRVHSRFRVSADSGATTVTFRLRFGASATPASNTALVGTTAVNSASGDQALLDFSLTGRAAPGATAAIVGSGLFSETAAAGAGTIKAAFLNTTNFATNGVLYVQATVEWSAADANAAQCEELVVELINAA